MNLLLRFKRWRIQRMQPRRYYHYVFSKMTDEQLFQMLNLYVDNELSSKGRLELFQD